MRCWENPARCFANRLPHILDVLSYCFPCLRPLTPGHPLTSPSHPVTKTPGRLVTSWSPGRHLVARSPNHRVGWSPNHWVAHRSPLGHPVTTGSPGHPVAWSLSHSITRSPNHWVAWSPGHLLGTRREGRNRYLHRARTCILKWTRESDGMTCSFMFLLWI